jgi:predicted nucleotidyltransferase
MPGLDELALDLGTSGRTLRRAAARGTIRAARTSPRRFEIERREREYVRRHWRLLATMLAALRTQPNVRLAVVFGSVSRGDEVASSDLDLIVQFREPSVRAMSQLIGRLESELERRVQVVELESAEQSPLLLADALRDGRVVVDRDRVWSRLKRREGQVEQAAADENERITDELVAAFEELFV